MYRDSQQESPWPCSRSEQLFRTVYLGIDVHFCSVKCTPHRNNFMTYTSEADTVAAVHIQDYAQMCVVGRNHRTSTDLLNLNTFLDSVHEYQTYQVSGSLQ